MKTGNHKLDNKHLSSKKVSELFVLVEERINIRKALSKENVCTFAKYASPKCRVTSDKETFTMT